MGKRHWANRSSIEREHNTVKYLFLVAMVARKSSCVFVFLFSRLCRTRITASLSIFVALAWWLVVAYLILLLIGSSWLDFFSSSPKLEGAQLWLPYPKVVGLLGFFSCLCCSPLLSEGAHLWMLICSCWENQRGFFAADACHWIVTSRWWGEDQGTYACRCMRVRWRSLQRIYCYGWPIGKRVMACWAVQDWESNFWRYLKTFCRPKLMLATQYLCDSLIPISIGYMQSLFGQEYWGVINASHPWKTPHSKLFCMLGLCVCVNVGVC